MNRLVLLTFLVAATASGQGPAPGAAKSGRADGAAVRVFTAAGRGPNLLRNPSCEPQGYADLTNPPGWNRWTEIGAAGQFVWDNQAGRGTIGHSSQYSLRVESTGERGGWIAAEPVAVSDGKLYLLCGFVSVHRSAGEVRYGVRFSGAAGLLGEAWSPAISGSTGESVSDWIAVAAKFRPPEGTTLAQVICRADFLTGAAWFDDVGLFELAESPAPLPAAGSQADFSAACAAVDRTVAELRERGRFWQAAAVATETARTLWGIARQDAAAGWARRSREHGEEARTWLNRAAAAARRGESRPDPLPLVPSSSPAVPFPAGVVLAYRGEAAPARVAAELEVLSRFGVTDIQADLPWGLWEPAQGSFDFSMPDALFAGAARLGQRIWGMSGPRYGQIGGRIKGSSTSLRGYTGWYLDRYPDAGLISAAGEQVKNVDGLFRDFSFLDPARLAAKPGWLATWEASVRALVAHVGHAPGLGGWLLSDAPRLGSGPDGSRRLLKPGLLGHNPEYVEGFRHWLKQRYATVGALRRAWGNDGVPTGKFEGVEPPGAEEIRAAIAPAAWDGAHPSANRYRGSHVWIADWLEFRATALAEGLAWQQRVIGGAVPVLPELTVTGPVDPDGLAADVIGNATAGPLAMNLTPGAVPFPLLTHAQDVALASAAAAGGAAGPRPVWLTAYSFHVSGVLGGDDRQNLFAAPYTAPFVWGAVLSGARGFFFDGWSGRTAPGSLAFQARLSATVFTLADEGIALARAAAALRVTGPWLASAAIAPPRYGLLVSRTGLLFDDPEAAHPLAMLNALALAGYHEVPVVTESALAAGTPPFDVLFAPYVTRLSPGAAAGLKAFVERGGVLVADSYLGTRDAAGEPRPPLADGWDEVFGVTPVASGTRWLEDGTIGSLSTPAFTELRAPLPVSLSWYPGGYQVMPGRDTEVLARYSGGAPGRELPSITVHALGQGRAVLIPRVRLWPAHVDALRGARLARPELRALRMGRTAPDLNGECWALTVRALLEHLDRLPAVRLVRAPVATAYLDDQASLQTLAGLSRSEKEVSRYLAGMTQGPALPFLTRGEVRALTRQFQVDVDALAPVRVNLLRGPAGRAAVVINVSSWGRDAELAVPGDTRAAADVLTGEEWAAVSGRLRVTLAPYQARLLALF